jgi:hypothetical protein
MLSTTYTIMKPHRSAKECDLALLLGLRTAVRSQLFDVNSSLKIEYQLSTIVTTQQATPIELLFFGSSPRSSFPLSNSTPGSSTIIRPAGLPHTLGRPGLASSIGGWVLRASNFP